MSLVVADPPKPLHHLPPASINPCQAVEPDRVERGVLDNVLSLGDITPDLFVVWPAEKDRDHSPIGFDGVIRQDYANQRLSGGTLLRLTLRILALYLNDDGPGPTAVHSRVRRVQRDDDAHLERGGRGAAIEGGSSQ